MARAKAPVGDPPPADMAPDPHAIQTVGIPQLPAEQTEQPKVLRRDPPVDHHRLDKKTCPNCKTQLAMYGNVGYCSNCGHKRNLA